MQNPTTTIAPANPLNLSSLENSLSVLQKKDACAALPTVREISSNHSGLTIVDVHAVAHARAFPIRAMNESVMDAGLLVSIEYISRNYGARVQVSEEMQDECATLIEQQFGDFSITEIVQAYRLWAAGKIDALEMYGGQFNVTQLGRVLASYRVYRFDINQALAREKNNAEAEARKVERNEQHREDHRRKLCNFPETVQAAIVNERYKSPSQIPITWYAFAEAHNMIEFLPGEKLALCLMAEKQIESERARQTKDAKNIFVVRSMQQHHESVGNAPIWNRAKQIILWVKVLNRKL
jgi:hypothetical protein